jgi:4-azaleucine resistance transporter AzlC
MTIHLRYGSFLTGLRAALPVMAGYLPIAFSFGLVSHAGGLTPWMAALMSAMVFAGASQFMALSMLGMGAPIPEIVVATLFMNLRHLVMNLSLLPRLGIHSWSARSLVSVGITDETFAVASFSNKADLLGTAGMLGLNGGAWAAWWAGTLMGGWVAPLIPKTVNDVMAVTLYGLFIGLLVPALRAVPKGVVAAGAAMAIHFGARQVLPAGWALVAAIILGALAGTISFGRDD